MALENGQLENEIDESQDEEEVFDPKIMLDTLKNDKDINELVKKTFDQMKALEVKRSALNDKMKAKRSTLEEHGIPIEAIKIAYKFYKMDMDRFQEAVIGVSLCTYATGQPVQIDFLDMDNITQIHK